VLFLLFLYTINDELLCLFLECYFVLFLSLSLLLCGNCVLQYPSYFIRIERFMPHVEIVYKHNAAARRLSIRGHNGKVYY